MGGKCRLPMELCSLQGLAIAAIASPVGSRWPSKIPLTILRRAASIWTVSLSSAGLSLKPSIPRGS